MFEVEFYDSHIIWEHRDFDEAYISWDSRDKKYKLINIKDDEIDGIEAEKWQDVVQYVMENIHYESNIKHHIKFNYLHTWDNKKIQHINKISDSWDNDCKGISAFVLMLR